jgi:hypothetical protein
MGGILGERVFHPLLVLAVEFTCIPFHRPFLYLLLVVYNVDGDSPLIPSYLHLSSPRPSVETRRLVLLSPFSLSIVYNVDGDSPSSLSTVLMVLLCSPSSQVVIYYWNIIPLRCLQR